MTICYTIPYTKCPVTGFIVEACNCIMCNQHRKEWLVNHNIEYELNEKTCNHFWEMDIMFDWYHCSTCGIMRRDTKHHAIKPSVLEPDEWKISQKHYFNDSKIKSDLLNKGNINPKAKGFRYPDLTSLANNMCISIGDSK